MTVTYKWSITSMESYKDKDGYKDVVFDCHWNVTATDGETASSAYGSIAIPIDNISKFIPYSDLTEDLVIGWVKDALTESVVKDIEDGLSGNINVLNNPISEKNPLPWA